MTATTTATRFNEKRHELREIAYELGRDDIFDRDLRGEGGLNPVPAGSDQAIETAISGVGWYLEEEFEHIEDEYERDAAYNNSPLVQRYHEIRRYING
jgi:hypothetical protein